MCLNVCVCLHMCLHVRRFVHVGSTEAILSAYGPSLWSILGSSLWYLFVIHPCNPSPWSLCGLSLWSLPVVPPCCPFPWCIPVIHPRDSPLWSFSVVLLCGPSLVHPCTVVPPCSSSPWSIPMVHTLSTPVFHSSEHCRAWNYHSQFEVPPISWNAQILLGKCGRNMMLIKSGTQRAAL